MVQDLAALVLSSLNAQSCLAICSMVVSPWPIVVIPSVIRTSSWAVPSRTVPTLLPGLLPLVGVVNQVTECTEEREDAQTCQREHGLQVGPAQAV